MVYPPPLTKFFKELRYMLLYFWYAQEMIILLNWECSLTLNFLHSCEMVSHLLHHILVTDLSSDRCNPVHGFHVYALFLFHESVQFQQTIFRTFFSVARFDWLRCEKIDSFLAPLLNTNEHPRSSKSMKHQRNIDRISDLWMIKQDQESLCSTQE